MLWNPTYPESCSGERCCLELPPIVQGGMGIAVSGWQLASAVSREGQLGVISSSGIASTFVQRLQRGDLGHHLREALAAFSFPAIAQRVLDRWYVPGGRADGQSLAIPPVPSWPMDASLTELTVVANFAEVYLAKLRGSVGPIGINLLTKVEVTTLASLYGAMLACVDVVFMGAGIPRAIPGVLDAFSRGEPATLPLSVQGAASREMRFSPAEFLQQTPPTLHRPAFFPIVSSETLASILVRKSNGRIDGFVVENCTAGGHNAPPRRSDASNSRGEPVWGELDRPSMAGFRKLGLPFYVAGGKSDSAALKAAQAEGAVGVQVGTAFAFSEESGILPQYKAAVLREVANGTADVLSSALASPTGFPFKVLQMAGTLSDPAIYAPRVRACDMGYLRTAYEKGDGSIGWRCPAEREVAYLSKGGTAPELPGRVCLCTALTAAAGMAAPGEPCIITAGDDIQHIGRYLRPGRSSYTARDVINTILERPDTGDTPAKA